MKIVVLLASVCTMTLLACSSPPSKIDGAPKVAPDEQFEVGGTFADRFLIWRCHEGQRVAMIQACSPHSCAGWRVFRGPCGKPTAGENATRSGAAALDGGSVAAKDGGTDVDASSDAELHKRHAIPEGSGWR